VRETAEDEWTITFGPLTLGHLSLAVLASEHVALHLLRMGDLRREP
jgi:hypothetical protein